MPPRRVGGQPLHPIYGPYTPAAALTPTRRRKAGVLFISAVLRSFTYGVQACLAPKSARLRLIATVEDPGFVGKTLAHVALAECPGRPPPREAGGAAAARDAPPPPRGRGGGC